MYATKRSDAAMELIKEFKTHDLTRKSSNDVVRPSKFKVTTKTTEEQNVPIPAARKINSNVCEFNNLICCCA